MEIKVKVHEGINIPPKYNVYKGGFVNLTMCKECKSIGLYEDQHPDCCCNNCGGVITAIGAGRFEDGKWQLRTIKL
jgi:hypothetical protein